MLMVVVVDVVVVVGVVVIVVVLLQASPVMLSMVRGHSSLCGIYTSF